MAALANPVINTRRKQQLSFSELAGRYDPDGNIAEIAEVLTETNDVLKDMIFVEGNLPTGHKFTMRTGLPEAFWVRMNMGVPASKSSTAQVEETVGECASRSIIDIRELKLNNNSKAWRHTEDLAHVEALNQAMTRALFYGTRQGDEGFVGFTPRYNTLDVKKADSAKNVISCGGTGDKLTSMWLISWGKRRIYGIYPKGSTVGLTVEDRGTVREHDPLGNPYWCYETEFTWQNGLCVEDWRYAVRICNINTEELKKGTGMGTGDLSAPNTENLITKMSDAICKLPAGFGNAAFYMNGDVHAVLNNIAIRANSNVLSINESLDEFGNHSSWTSFLGHPLRRVDALQANEKEVK